MLLEWAEELLSKKWSVWVMGGVGDTPKTVMTINYKGTYNAKKNVDESCNK